MKRLMVIIFILFCSCTLKAQELDLKNYLTALKTAEFDESKKVIDDLSFPDCKQYTISSFEGISGIAFETDVKGIKAYKAIFNCKAKNKLGAFIDKRMMSVSYFDKTAKKWRVFDMREPVTPCDEFQYAKKNIDISGAQYSWRLVSYWALMCGKLLEAKEAIETSESRARAINDNDFSNPYNEVVKRIYR
jgi:hypothetical protein